jgi:uncharacterized protein (TIGR02611 family)
VDRLRGLLGVIVRSTRRLAVLVVGCAVTTAGLVMMVTPGPGLVVIIAGLAILATEFTWAEILLERAKKQALRAKNAAFRRGAGLVRRRRTIVLEVTELIEPPDGLVHGPPTPDGHVELLSITVVERVDIVDLVDRREPQHTRDPRDARESGGRNDADEPGDTLQRHRD